MSKYYKFGGYEPSFHWFKFSLPMLAEAVAGDRSPLRPAETKVPVEVTLGIEASGATALLLNESQFQALWRVYGGGEPAPNRVFTSRDFESLSPIGFVNTKSLLQKLKKLKPGLKTKVDRDTSQANKGYISTTDGPPRGSFELNRCLYRLINGGIDANQYNLNDECSSKIRICSLIINTWAQDGRPADVRRCQPKILDIGVTSLQPILQVERTSKHFVVKQNRMLNQELRETFEHGDSEEATIEVISSRLRDILLPGPVVLLVAGANITKDVLNSMDVDTSEWANGIKSLVQDDIVQPTSPPKPRYHREAEPSSSHRSRSHSPRRPPNSYNSSRSSTYASSRTTSTAPSHHRRSPSFPSPRRQYRPVYMVDVQQMYIKMKKTGDKDDIYYIAEYLQVHASTTTANAAASRTSMTFCAGNESRLLVDIWAAMASGSPIDEQNEERALVALNLQRAREASLQGAASRSNIKVESVEAAVNATCSGQDEDEDPFYDMEQAIQQQASGKGHDYYDVHSDYGSDTD